MSLGDFQSLLGGHQMWSICENMHFKVFGAFMSVLEGVPLECCFFIVMLLGAIRSAIK